MSASGIVSIYVTFGSEEEAERIGRTVVEERLAACINIMPGVRSIYRWRGKVEVADECAAILKTTAFSADLLIKRVAELHSYDNPAITVWPIDNAPAPFIQWVKVEMR